jgi:hypothetical protein
MFEEAVTHVVDTITADPTVGGFTILRNTDANFDDKLRTALRTQGIAIAVAGLQARLLEKDQPIAPISFEIVAAVTENPGNNQTGVSILQAVEAIIRAVHQSKIPTEKGLRKTIVVDDPPFEIADLDNGTTTYIANFRHKIII